MRAAARAAGTRGGAAFGGRRCPSPSGSAAATAATSRPGRASAGRRRRSADARRRRRRGPGPLRARHRVRVADHDELAGVRANAAFRLAEYERGRSFSMTRAPCRSAGRLPGMLATTRSSSTCGASARQRRLELPRMSVRDDDAASSHRPPSTGRPRARRGPRAPGRTPGASRRSAPCGRSGSRSKKSRFPTPGASSTPR